MLQTLLGLCLALSGKAAKRPAPRRRPAFHRLSCRPRLEALEDRCLLSAGALDPTFGNGAGYVTTAATSGEDTARAVLIQPDGKIVAAGEGDIVNVKKNVLVAEDFAVVRYNTNGSLDTSFGSGGTALANFGYVNGGKASPTVYGSAYAAALQPDGKIVLSGAITSYFPSISSRNFTTQTALALARFNANGTLDTTFGNQGEVTTSFSGGTNGYEGGVVVQPDGKIVAAEGNATGFELARYNANGTLDATFGAGGKVITTLGTGSSYAGALLLQPDGKLIVAGELDLSSGGGVRELARYNADGSLDTSFGNGGIVSGPVGGDSSAWNAALYPTGTANAGKIVVVVRFPAGDWGLVRYNPDGSLDSSFGSGGEVHSTGELLAVAIAADGKIVAAGNSGGEAVFRYNTDGSVDSTFGTGGVVTTAIGSNSAFEAVVLQSNGDIVSAGHSNYGQGVFTVARYLPSDPEIGSFTANPNPVTAGSSDTLTAANITDLNPGSTITQVAFYYYDRTGTKQVLGYGTQTSPGVWTLTYTVNLASGTYTIDAQAEDSYGVFGDPLALTLTVQ